MRAKARRGRRPRAPFGEDWRARTAKPSSGLNKKKPSFTEHLLCARCWANPEPESSTQSACPDWWRKGFTDSSHRAQRGKAGILAVSKCPLGCRMALSCYRCSILILTSVDKGEVNLCQPRYGVRSHIILSSLGAGRSVSGQESPLKNREAGEGLGGEVRSWRREASEGLRGPTMLHSQKPPAPSLGSCGGSASGPCWEEQHSFSKL